MGRAQLQSKPRNLMMAIMTEQAGNPTELSYTSCSLVEANSTMVSLLQIQFMDSHPKAHLWQINTYENHNSSFST